MDESTVTPDPQEQGEEPARAEKENADPENTDRVRLVLDLPAGESVRLTVETITGEVEGQQPAPLGAIVVHPSGEIETLSGTLDATLLPDSSLKTSPELRTSWQSLLVSLPVVLFALSLLVYLLTRLIALPDFPIYFFTDEAVQTVLAADLIRDGLHGWEGEFLPAYFKNGNYYNLSASVYLQVLPYLLFGKSVFVTRAVSVFVSSAGRVLRGDDLARFRKNPLLVERGPAAFDCPGLVSALAHRLRDGYLCLVLLRQPVRLPALPAAIGALPLSHPAPGGPGVLLVQPGTGGGGCQRAAALARGCAVPLAKPEHSLERIAGGAAAEPALPALPPGAPRGSPGSVAPAGFLLGAATTIGR